MSSPLYVTIRTQVIPLGWFRCFLHQRSPWGRAATAGMSGLWNIFERRSALHCSAVQSSAGQSVPVSRGPLSQPGRLKPQGPFC